MALTAAVPLWLMWLLLALLGVGVPTPGHPTEATVAPGPASLTVSTVLAFLTVVAVLPAMFILGMAHDSVHGLPRRSGAVVLLYVLPVLALVTALAAWVCYALAYRTAARYLGLGPWVAALGMVATVAVVQSGAATYARTHTGTYADTSTAADADHA